MRKKVTIGVALLLSLSLLVACGGVAQEDYDAAVAAKTAADAKVTSLTSQLATAKSDLAKAASGLAAAQGELATAQSDLEAAQDEAASAESAASSAKSAASSAKSALAAAEATVAELEATIAELEAAAAAVEEEEVVEEEEDVVEEEEEVVEEEEEEVVEEEEEEVVELTFTPAEYVNEEYGFSVKYPNLWYEETAEGDLHTAIGPPYTIPGVSISVSDITEDVSFADGLAAGQEEAGNTDIEIVSVTETTLADGTTPATLVVLTYFDTASGNPIDAVAIGVEVDGKRITVFVYTVEIYAPFSLEQKTEVCMTLTFQ